MSYFSDFSAYNYFNANPDGSFNIGWLDATHNYEEGSVSVAFLARLWRFLHYPVHIFRGFHDCELCPQRQRSEAPIVQFKGQEMKIGFHEIRVFSPDQSKVYAAPTLIFHYIMEHHYLPPEEFIQAVMLGPDPDSDTYRKLMIPFGHSRDRQWWSG